MDFPLLDCGVVRLRPFLQRDLRVFTGYRADPEVARYQGWSEYTYEDAERLFSAMQGHPFGAVGKWFQLAIASSETDDLLGDLAVHFIDDVQVEVGFTMSREHQGRGFVSSALRHLLGYLFQRMHKHRIIATIDVENVPARHLLERLGFRQEAHFVDNIFFKGAWGSEFQYAMLASEWTHEANCATE